MFASGHVNFNKVQRDDSSCYSNGPMMAHRSTASSSHAFCELVHMVENGSFHSISSKIDFNNVSNEVSEILRPDDAENFSIIDSNCNYERTETRFGNSKLSGFSNVIEIDLETVSRPKIGLYEDLGCQRNDHSDGSTLEIPKSQIHTYEDRKTEDVVFSCSNHSQNKVPDGHFDISSASCEPLHIENESSSADIAQSEVEPRNPSAIDQFSGTHKHYDVLETLSGGIQRSTDSSELKLNYEDLEKEESDEVDILIQKAAESLIHISLESPARYKDFSTRDGASNEMENDEIQRPKCRSDFYELITLKLTESCADDLSVSSKPPDVNFTDKIDYGFKLRRGSRLKDFQKDILPGLASLSRHEIREDINILEGVLRSREYRKMRAELGDGQSWFTPTRSKRSGRKNL